MNKLIFVLLKMVEIPIIVFGPYYFYCAAFSDEAEYAAWEVWLGGFFVLFVGAAALAIAYGVCLLMYKSNIELAGRITQWLKGDPK